MKIDGSSLVEPSATDDPYAMGPVAVEIDCDLDALAHKVWMAVVGWLFATRERKERERGWASFCRKLKLIASLSALVCPLSASPFSAGKGLVSRLQLRRYNVAPFPQAVEGGISSKQRRNDRFSASIARYYSSVCLLSHTPLPSQQHSGAQVSRTLVKEPSPQQVPCALIVIGLCSGKRYK